MSLLRQTNTDIVVELSDLVIGDTKIKRKGYLESMVYSPADKRVVINFRVVPFAVATGDTYGAPLANSNFQTYFKVQVADNSSYVDAQTGQLLGDVYTLDADPSSTLEGGLLYGRDYMYEFEFYKMIAGNQPVIIDQLIIAKIQEADAQGKLN